MWFRIIFGSSFVLLIFNFVFCFFFLSLLFPFETHFLSFSCSGYLFFAIKNDKTMTISWISTFTVFLRFDIILCWYFCIYLFPISPLSTTTKATFFTGNVDILLPNNNASSLLLCKGVQCTSYKIMTKLPIRQ